MPRKSGGTSGLLAKTSPRTEMLRWPSVVSEPVTLVSTHGKLWPRTPRMSVCLRKPSATPYIVPHERKFCCADAPRGISATTTATAARTRRTRRGERHLNAASDSQSGPPLARAATQRMTITCADCGATQVIPSLPSGATAECHRCDRLLARRSEERVAITLVSALAICILLPPPVFLPLLASTIRNLVFGESRLVSSVHLIYGEVSFPFAFGF